MATSKNLRNSHVDSHRRGRLPEKSTSFYGNSSSTGNSFAAAQIHRPKTVPDLLSDSKRAAMKTAKELSPRQPPKLLLKVTMMGSLGPVQVIMTPESTVGDLAAAAVKQYVKEGRRPILPSSDPSKFDLHYSQFSLESLCRDEKLREVRSRNFFMCPRKCDGDDVDDTTAFEPCSRQTEKSGGGIGLFSWLRFMNCLL